MGKYSKLWMALAGAAVQFLSMLLGASNSYTVLAVSLLTALGVCQVPNQEN